MTDRTGKPTVRDVSAYARVSIGTVSRYLNGHVLREETRRRVEAALTATGYKAPSSPSRPQKVRTRTIGVVFPQYDDFHVSVIQALDKILSRESYHMVTCEYEGNEDQLKDKIRLLRDIYADGIICSAISTGYNINKEVINLGIPVVSFNNKVESWQCDHVSVDDRIAMQRAVEYCIDLGHESIALISGPTRSSTGYERVQGYRSAIVHAGIPERADLLMVDDWGLSEHHAYDAMGRLLAMNNPPTAIIAGHSRVGIGVLRHIREARLEIPHDISLICFDDTELFQLCNPPVTTIRQPAATIAAETAALLFRRMEGDIEDGPVNRIINTELILRDSVRRIIRRRR